MINNNPEIYGMHGGAHLMGTKVYTNKQIDECVEMLGNLIESAYPSMRFSDGITANTLIKDVDLSSFNFVLNKAISLLLKYQEANI